MHELVAIVAGSQEVDGDARAHPLEQNLENAEPAVTENGARAHDTDRQTAFGELASDRFAFELGAPIRFARPRWSRGGDRVFVWDSVDRARRDENHLAHAGPQRFVENDAYAVDVHTPKFFPILRERNLRHVVVHDFDPLERAPHRIAIAHVAFDERDFLSAIFVSDQVEN